MAGWLASCQPVGEGRQLKGSEQQVIVLEHAGIVTELSRTIGSEVINQKEVIAARGEGMATFGPNDSKRN